MISASQFSKMYTTTGFNMRKKKLDFDPDEYDDDEDIDLEDNKLDNRND